MKSTEGKTKSATFFIAGFLILSAIILAIGRLYYGYALKSYRVLIDQELSAIADLKEKEIMQWREERLGDVSVFYKNDVFSSLVQRYFEKPDDAETLKGIQIWLRNVQVHYSYRRVSLIDSKGVERLSIPKATTPVDAVISRRCSEIMKSKQIVFEDFYRNEHDTQIYLTVLAPIIDNQDSTHVLGIISLQIDPEHYLYPLISNWPIPSKTAETILLRREGNEVVFLNDLKFQKDAALNLRIPMNGTKAIPAIKAALGEEGIVEALDYRGVPVIAEIRTIHGSPWFMVTRMDQSEAFAPLKERLLVIVVLIGLLLVAIEAVFGFIWKNQNARFYRERFEASKKLRESEERYESLVQTSIDGYWVADTEGHILEVNDAYCLMTGYPREKILTMRIRDLEAVETPEITREHIEKIIASGGFDRFESKHRCVDGKIIDVTISIIYLPSQNIFLIFVNNITELKQKEEQLNIQSTALNAAANAVVITNNSGKIEWVNLAFTKLTGYTLEEVTGENPHTIKSGKHDAAFYKDLWNTILAGKVWQGEMINKRKDGGEYTEEMTITPLLDNNGDIIRFIAIKQDITERKKFEEELIIAKAEAEQANLAKSEFLSRMSHELRTPMNSILGYAQLMDMGELKPAHKKGVDHILKSGKHLLDLINEVLDISKIEAGHISLSLEPIAICSLVREIMDVVSPMAAGEQITLETVTLDKLFVKADRQRLKQVLLNLVNNAIKYNRQNGFVKINCELTEAAEKQNPTVRISISDSGGGISPEDMIKLFNPFERIGAEKTETEGTGLGLAVAKKLIEAMHGTIGVESELGKGSTFWIELPQTECQIDRLERLDQIKPELEKAEVSGTILYIEDNVSNIQLVEQILEAHRPGIRLITEMYGKNAVKLATDFAPDLILLDLDLPDIHGSEVLKLLQAGPKTDAIPVVILSADAMNTQIEKLMQAGARNYLTKPLDILEFLRMVDEFLSRE